MESMPGPSNFEPLAVESRVVSAAQPARPNYLTIAQLIVSGLGIVFSLVVAGLMLVTGLVGLFSQRGEWNQTVILFSMAWLSLLIALLCLPSVVFSVARLSGSNFGQSVLQRMPRMRTFALASVLLLLWPLALAAGNAISVNPDIAWLALPPLQILAIGLPVWWLFEAARRNLPFGSRQRGWGVFNFSMLITTPIVVIVEIIVLIVVAILAILYINTRPDLMLELQQLVFRLSTIDRENTQAILEMIKPLLQNPLAVFAILSMIAGIIPLLEELFKPLAIWLLAGRRLTPAEGFVAGALCGASFALIESLMNFNGITGAGGGWAALAIGRAGTALLHIATTALVGWGMALAWHNGSYGRLALSYLIAVFLHGLWNALNVLMGLGIIFEGDFPGLAFLNGLSQAAPLGIVALTVLLFMLLWGSNQRLQRAVQADTQAAS